MRIALAGGSCNAHPSGTSPRYLVKKTTGWVFQVHYRRGQFSSLGDVTSIPCEIESLELISSSQGGQGVPNAGSNKQRPATNGFYSYSPTFTFRPKNAKNYNRNQKLWLLVFSYSKMQNVLYYSLLEDVHAVFPSSKIAGAECQR
jgi:hypothetical protein